MRTAVATAPMAFSPSVGCGFRAKDAPKFGDGRLDALTYSLRNLGLSIEMNAKTTDSFKRTIEFRDVSYHINDIPAGVVLSDISLSIPRGETLVLLRRGIGYVIQEAGLFPHFTVAENVALVPTLEKWDPARIAARVDEMLQLVGLDPREFARRRSRELSGGQRQRVGVARALAADPPILLMDEPFGALDPVTRAELQREFSALARRLGKTIVFVTHDLREALLLASRIVLLQGGRMVASASPQEFLRLDHPEVRAFTASLIVAPGVPA